MDPVEPPQEDRDDPVESGALEEEGAATERPPAHEEPVESGGLEDERAGGDR